MANNRIKILAAAVAIAGAPFLAQGQTNDLTPTILNPDPANGALIYGLSDNGNWGVSNVLPESSGFSDFAGAILHDLRTSPVKSTNLSGGHLMASAFDVTDDGTIVVGSVDQTPAVCRLENGKWVWHKLPTSMRQETLENEFTGFVGTYVYDGGEVLSVTPDGRWGVGYCQSNEYIMLQHPYIWDLSDLSNPKGMEVNSRLHPCLVQISADGRFVTTNSGQLWDRETDEIRQLPLTNDIYAQGMSTNGRYFAGVIERNDVPFAAVWDRENDKLTVIDGENNADAVAWTITNEGLPLVARPYITLYADAYAYKNGFLYSFDELYEDVYGLNLNRYGIDLSGKPFKVSADGRTVVFITGRNESYVARFKEDIADGLDRINLFKRWSASPVSNSSVTAVSNIVLTFAHPVELVSGEGIALYDSAGTRIASPVSSGGVIIEGDDKLSITFFPRTLNKGEKYTVVIPAGALKIKGLDATSPEFTLSYTGRGTEAVTPLSVKPEQGSSLAMLSLNDNPVSIRFDASIKVNVPGNGERPSAKVFIDEDPNAVAWLNLDVDQNTGRDLILFPDYNLPLYKGSEYRIVLPAGAVTDMSGYGASAEYTITYTGSYVPELGDDRYLFRSTCDDYANFLFYEGDHGEPVAEYAAMNFTADNTPWAVVTDDESSTDMSFGSHSCYTDGRQADDWVATRQILIPEDGEAYLSFDSQSYRRNKQDYLKVLVYENANMINSLTADIVDDIRKNGDVVYHELQTPGATEDGLAGEWTHNVIDLKDYAGKPIYIAFLNENRNQSMVIIDNIEVVKNVKAFITIRSKENVVDLESAPVSGLITVTDATETYNNLQMTLKDAAGNAVSTLSASGISLTAGDAYSFEFPQELPLEYGVENRYTIEFALDDEQLTYQGVLRCLTYAPVKRVLIEEFTGRDCQFCPGGILEMGNLEALYGDRIVPVALHCYNGADPKGANVMDYWQFTGMGAAPQARVNRGPVSSPLYQSPNGYTDLGGPWGEMLWRDYVQQEFEEIALMEVSIESHPREGNVLPYTATIKSAVNLENVNVRVFAVLLEDHLDDYQVNTYYNNEDPFLGPWGKGGVYGSSTVRHYYFDNVARGIWGSSFIGIPGLVPTTLAAGQSYEVAIDMPIPAIVDNIDNCKTAVILIEEGTGKVINARMSKKVSGVDVIGADEEEGPAVYYNLQGIPVQNPAEGEIYIVKGRKVIYRHP